MKLYCKNENYTLYNGKMQEVLSELEENSIDSIITDPPYELNFMGKGWDNSGVAFQKETWEYCFRVLKPGGYLLAFGGTRTYHRIACAIEDAGFEIRDCIMWLYGSGFPKSMNIGLAIDKKNGVESQVVGKRSDETLKSMQRFKEQDGRKHKENFENIGYIKQSQNEWSGWGTCLKPAYEPIIIARKPFKNSLVDNVIEYGVGGINIDECRVGEEHFEQQSGTAKSKGKYGDKVWHEKSYDGRFPANVILTYDDTDKDEVCGGMPDTKGGNRNNTAIRKSEKTSYGYELNIRNEFDDEGSAARYFYCAKASKKDRDEGMDMFEEKQTTDGCIRKNSETAREFGANSALRKNIHPTVKPVELMQYLVRLVSPKGATILDCFMGSGSTGKAVMFENRERNANYHFIGVEMTDEYLPICNARIDYALNKYEYDYKKELQEMKELGQLSLFEEEEN